MFSGRTGGNVVITYKGQKQPLEERGATIHFFPNSTQDPTIFASSSSDIIFSVWLK